MNRTDTQCRHKAMRNMQIASFSAIETALYLDTHPYDKEALAAMKKYCEETAAATAAYEAEYGPITFCACPMCEEEGNQPYFRWALTPMPWETEECQ